jgi:hypothetical protein
MKIKFIAPASDFASTKYTPSKHQHRASHYAFGQAELTRSGYKHAATRRNALLHAGPATGLNMSGSLPYYLPNTLAGAINNFFMVYPQKYITCSTLGVL